MELVCVKFWFPYTNKIHNVEYVLARLTVCREITCQKFEEKVKLGQNHSRRCVPGGHLADGVSPVTLQVWPAGK